MYLVCNMAYKLDEGYSFYRVKPSVSLFAVFLMRIYHASNRCC